MKTKTFVQKTSNLFVDNKLIKFLIVVLGLTVAFNSFMVYRAVKYQRVVLIPPKLTGTIEFVQGKPTEKYLRDMGQRIVNLAATYSPATARAQFEDLLFHFAPESYPEASENWYSLAGRIEDSQVSSAYYPEKITIHDKTIEVFGALKQFTGKTPLENTTRTYLINYRVQDGRFYVVSLKEKVAPESTKEKSRDQ